MGRPWELTHVDREKLLTDGYKPFEVWLPDWDDPAFLARLKQEFESIRVSDRRTQMDETHDAFACDVWNELS